MVEIEEMNERDVREWLGKINYAHLGCCRDDLPYVVPVHYAYDGESLYVYTTEGKKAEIIQANPQVCLQAEKVQNDEDWVSVMAIGEAQPLTEEADRQHALDLILQVNPRLTPALSIRWMDSWVRENIEVIYRIRPRSISGRMTVKRNRPARSLSKPRPDIH